MADDKVVKPAMPAAVAVATTKKSEKEELAARQAAILKEYEQESNIPLWHEYWDIRNRLQYLMKGGK